MVGLTIGRLFIVLGNVLGKVRSNFMFGVRTPWTLASDPRWNKTHRLVGRLFVLLGWGSSSACRAATTALFVSPDRRDRPRCWSSVRLLVPGLEADPDRLTVGERT